MSKRKRGVGALNKVMSTGTEMLTEGLGGVAGGYVSKLGTYSPVLPDQAGALASIIVGGAVKIFMPNNLANNFGGGLVAVGFYELAKSFGVGGVEIINGTEAADQKMIADYQRQKAAGGSQIINGDIINGLMRDNAVAKEEDLY